MQIDPAEEYLRLTALYGQMSEIELADLARGYDGLRETAQQVLRDEMRKRGLRDPSAPPPPVRRTARPAGDETAIRSSDAIPEGEPGGEEADYTWKTVLCECEELPQADQLVTALREAGLDAWLEAPNYTFHHGIYPRVLVAADQLEEAREIAARPIPREVVELSSQDLPEYEAPICPACGSADPILETTGDLEEEEDLAYHWRCESCGREWSDQTAEPTEGESGETR